MKPEIRSVIVVARYTKSERRLLDHAAQRNGVTLSQLVRATTLSAAHELVTVNATQEKENA